MPIYYKKVNANALDVNYAERGQRFTFGIKRKLSNNRKSLDGVELESIHPTRGTSAADSSANAPLISAQNGTQSFGDNTRFDGDIDRDECEEKIITKYGPILVAKQESSEDKPGKPVILTYHDIGLNYSSNFESFFSVSDNRLLLESFTVYHVTAPGQEFNADDLAANYLFPTMDQLAEQVVEVCAHYKIAQFIGFGCGAGANVLSRVALTCPELVDGLFLIHPSATVCTWSEWFYQKRNLRQLLVADPVTNDRSLPPLVQNYLLWHMFGDLNFPDRVTDDEAVDMYRRYFADHYINRRNLGLFIESYIGRTELTINREDRLNNFKCTVAVVCGQNSPHVDESVRMNAKLVPSDSTWIKLSDGAMVLEEQPHKLGQSFRLFLQGLGYTLKHYERKRALITGMSMPCLTGSGLSLHTAVTSGRRQTLAAVNEV